MSRKNPVKGEERAPPAARIAARIEELGDWRSRALARVRELIRQADPGVVEEWKWVKPSSPGVPVWSHDGILCTGEVYRDKVKLTFAKGASLEDPAGIFNASLQGNVRRAIDLREGDELDARAFKALVRAAVALNGSRTGEPKLAATRNGAAGRGKGGAAPRRTNGAAKQQPVLLSGGNPQIPKGDGDAPVQAYLAAMPGWKREVGRRLDALVVRTVPGVRKAVRWNSPFYGVEGRGWFLSFHCFTRYVKVTFFRGASLRPVPPGASKDPNVRYLDIHEGEPIEEARLSSWIRQASKLPGWTP